MVWRCWATLRVAIAPPTSKLSPKSRDFVNRGLGIAIVLLNLDRDESESGY